MTRCVLLLIFLITLQSHANETVLVRDNTARSEIVIAENALLSVRLAAQELQNYLGKTSGAHVPIVTGEGTAGTVKVFVGRSPQNDKRNLAAPTLKEGGYRISVGPDFVALLGQDTEFTPIEPWPNHNGELASGKLRREWDQITGALWGAPKALMYKDRFTVAGDTGLPGALRVPGHKYPPPSRWGFDERAVLMRFAGYCRNWVFGGMLRENWGQWFPWQKRSDLRPWTRPCSRIFRSEGSICVSECMVQIWRCGRCVLVCGILMRCSARTGWPT